MPNKNYLPIKLPHLKMAIEALFVFIFISYALNNWKKITETTNLLTPSALILCLTLYWLAQFIAAAAAQKLFSRNNYNYPYKFFIGIHINRLPGKYIPGGIWQTIGRGSDLIQQGIPIKSVTKILFSEQALAILWAGSIGFFLTFFIFGKETRLFSLLFFGALFLGAAIALYLSHKIKPEINRFILTTIDPLLCVYYVSGWLCLAGAFTCFIWFNGLLTDNPLKITASYLVSWMIGALAFFAPQGVGVFEVVIQRLAFSSFKGGNILWLIASYRLVTLFADLSLWLFYKLFNLPLLNKSRGK